MWSSYLDSNKGEMLKTVFFLRKIACAKKREQAIGKGRCVKKAVGYLNGSTPRT